MEIKIFKLVIPLIILLIIIAFITNGFYIIKSGEQAVVERLMRLQL